MRVPRVRFTVRWIMAAVAVVAIGLGVRTQLAHWHQLARSYDITARRLGRLVAAFRTKGDMSHEQWDAHCRAVDERNRRGPPTWGSAEPYWPEPAAARRHADYLDLKRKKYQRAAAQPWWPLEPDPPPPHYGSQ
jgi:hypothetical protein